MEIAAYNVVYLVTYIFVVYCIKKIMELLEGTAKNKWKEMIAYVTFYIVSTGAYLLFRLPIATASVNVVGLFLLSRIYIKNWKRNVVTVFLIYLFLIVSEGMGISICGFIPGNLWVQTQDVPIMGLFMHCILSFLLVQLFKQCTGIRDSNYIPWKYGMCILLILILSIGYIVSLAGEIPMNKYVKNAILIVVIDFLVVFLYDALLNSMWEENRSRMIEEQNKSYAKELALLMETQKSLRIIRHDMKNHMLEVLEIIKKNNNDKAQEYLLKMLNNVQVTYLLADSGNTAIDSMINYKAEMACQKGVRVNVMLKIPAELEIDSFDLSVLLGNLLDNAIEAAEKVHEKESFVNLRMTLERNQLFIVVENLFDGQIVWNNNIPQTVKEDKETHGIGIMSIKRIVDKYQGVIVFSPKGDMFVTKCMLYFG